MWKSEKGLAVLFPPEVKFDWTDLIPVVEGGHLTVSAPFQKIICKINSFFFPNYLFKNFFQNDSVQRGLRCIDCRTSVLLYTCTDKIFKFNQIILNNIIWIVASFSIVASYIEVVLCGTPSGLSFLKDLGREMWYLAQFLPRSLLKCNSPLSSWWPPQCWPGWRETWLLDMVWMITLMILLIFYWHSFDN